MRFHRSLALLAVWTSAVVIPSHAAEVQPSYAEHTLCVVELAQGESVAVISESFESVRVIQGESKAVFTGPPQKYAVMVSHPERGLRVQVTRIVRGDSPPPGPGPAPPGPTVPNKYGVGKPTYDAAIAVGDKLGVGVLADIWDSAQSRFAGLNTGSTVGDVTAINQWIAEQSRARLPNVARWQPWSTTVKQALGAAWDSGHTSREAYAEMIAEVLAALRAAQR